MIGTNLAITPKRFAPLGSSNDADAQAFITAAGITDGTQQSAVNQLVLDLKSASIWTKMKAIYPIVGGSASTHKWNLKDPRDLDAAFRLTFTTGWTHSSNGMLPNGTSAYADTYLRPSISLSLNSSHASYYSRTNSQGNIDIGASGYLTTTGKFYSYFKDASNQIYFRVNKTTNPESILSSTDSRKYYIINRNSSTNEDIYINNVKTTFVTSSQGQPTITMYLGASNMNTTPFIYGNKQCAFASIGDGLTDTEASNFYTAINTYQTTLGRNV